MFDERGGIGCFGPWQWSADGDHTSVPGDGNVREALITFDRDQGSADVQLFVDGLAVDYVMGLTFDGARAVARAWVGG